MRDRISERFGHNTKALCDRYRQMEKKHPDRMLRECTDVPIAKNER